MVPAVRVREKYLGPTTTKSPNGFRLRQKTVDAVIQATDMYECASLMTKDIQTLFHELRDTPGIVKLDYDYGEYDVRVTPSFPFVLHSTGHVQHAFNQPRCPY